MISELIIEKYRGINNLKLENLGKVNIIAGENNTGKTSILEVIQSLKGPNSLREWRLVGRREGNGFRPSTTIYDTMKSLFPINNEDNKTNIIYSGKVNGKSFSVELDVKFSEVILTNEQLDIVSGYSRTQLNRDEYEYHEYDTSVLDISYNINGENCGEDKVYSIQRAFISSEHATVNIINNVVYVSPTQHANNTLYLDSLLTDSDMYEQFVDIMKEFDSDFVSINSVKEEQTFSNKYVVLSKKFKEGLLLNAYGDGMKKAMLLLSAVLRAKDGILLLDEFETAIHVSVMGKVFKWIIENASKLNVQIFMTSHSIEAIESVLKCCPEMQNDIKMITLVDTENGLKVRNVDAAKAVQLMDDYGLELR